MTALVRADALRSYLELVGELGGDAKALLAAAEVPSAAMRNSGESYIPLRGMIELLEHSAEALEVKDFGLRLAAQQDLGIFGPLALAAQNCETVADAIDCFAQYFHTHNQGLQFVVRPLPGGRSSYLGAEILLSRPPPHTQFDERNVKLIHQCLKLLSGEAYHPLRVLLPHSRLSPAATYRACFGSAVQFEQERAAIEISAEDLRRPVRGHNPQLRKIATAFLESQGPKSQATLARRVREAIKPLLPSGRCSQVNLADALHLHPRTLQRRLAEEGTSFEDLKDEVRREMAEQYLGASVLPLSQVTALLGYSEQSALTRSCRRWFRRAPLALRRRGRGGDR
jgi:AraC-like DNA-binding protein